MVKGSNICGWNVLGSLPYFPSQGSGLHNLLLPLLNVKDLSPFFSLAKLHNFFSVSDTHNSRKQIDVTFSWALGLRKVCAFRTFFCYPAYLAFERFSRGAEWDKLLRISFIAKCALFEYDIEACWSSNVRWYNLRAFTTKSTCFFHSTNE